MDIVVDNVKLSESDIGATLQYGGLYTGKFWRAIYMVLFILLSLVLLTAGFQLILSYFYSDIDREFSIIFCIIVLIVTGIVIMSYCFIRYGVKRIKPWLKDAVLLKAQTQVIATNYGGRGFKQVAIQVRFVYKKKKYTVDSTNRRKYIATISIYDEYADREIYILYTPSYNQVLLLKPQCYKRIEEELNNEKKAV